MNYYAIRIEFQVRVLPRVHCFLCIIVAPNLSEDNIENYISFADKIAQAYLPNKNENLEFYESIKLYRLQRHYRTCQKYKNEVCRFHFGKLFAKYFSLVARLLPSNMPEDMKLLLLQNRTKCLPLVQDYQKLQSRYFLVDNISIFHFLSKIFFCIKVETLVSQESL